MDTGTSNKDALIRIENLCRSFVEGEKNHKVLNDVSIEVQQGDTIALRGRSGSGKSTLLNLISGIDAPDAGNVWIAGSNISAMSERDRTVFRREKIGFVYQAFNLVPTLTVADNVRLVLELNGVRDPEATERVSWLLDAVDLIDRGSSFPDVLSGGEQQRVAIARALAHNPTLLLADEPTGNLDEQTAASVLQLLDKLVRKTGGTMIVATHSNILANTCDRVIELRNGKLAV